MTEHAPIRGPTILIVEPDHNILKALRMALEPTLAVQIVSAEDAPEVMPLTIERPPDLIIVDVHTRRFNAFEIIADLKRNPVTSGIPVIAMGPRGDQVALAWAMECADTLELPLQFPEVMSKVLKHLEVQIKPRGLDGDISASRNFGDR